MSSSLPTIVCVHGLLGFDVLAVGPIAFAKYFRMPAPWLKAKGYKVLTPAVPPIGSIERRAEALRAYLLRECPNDRIVLLAHSMGGLDSRFLLTHRGDGLNIESLVTLVTPHHGSAVAEAVFSTTERFKLVPFLERAKIDLNGLRDLRPSACEEFNARTPDRPDVRYFSIISQQPRADIRLSLKLSCGHLEQVSGPNDGLVSVTSGRWGQCLGEWNLDHMEILGHGRLGAVSPRIRKSLEGMMESIRTRLV